MKKIANELIEYFKVFFATFFAKDVLGKSAQTAYYFVFSIFPISLLIVSILPFLEIDIATVEEVLYSELPLELADFLYQLLYNAFSTHNSYIVLGALLLTFWSASAATNAIMKGINVIYDGKVTRNYILGRFISFLLTISFFVYIAVTILSVTFTSSIFDTSLTSIHLLQTILEFISRFILPIFISGILIILYYVAPSKKMTIKQTLPGVLFWIISFNVFTYGFSIYMGMTDFASAYGGFAGIIIFMLWCYAVSAIILTGAVINVTLYKYITNKRNYNIIDNE